MDRRFRSSAFLTLLAFGLNGCQSVQIDPHPAFQLTYIDTNEQVRVRYSDDGQTWTDGNLLSAFADAGVGASASPDPAGVTRVVAEGGLDANLRLWFGLGPANWGSSPVALPALRPARRPTIVDVGASKFLLAFLPINSSSFQLHLFDHGSGETTALTVPNFGNDDLHFSPAMIFLPANAAEGRPTGRVAVAWGRYASDNATEPFEIRTMGGAVNQDGSVNLVAGSIIRSDSLDAATFQGPIPHLVSDPALASDHTQFILASHQRFFGVLPQNRSNVFVQMHGSTDGLNWEIGLFQEFTGTQFVVPGQLEFAVQPNCTAVFVFLPSNSSPPHAQLHLPDGTDQTLPANQLFGANLPERRQFALIATGKPANVPSFGCTHF